MDFLKKVLYYGSIIVILVIIGFVWESLIQSPLSALVKMAYHFAEYLVAFLVFVCIPIIAIANLILWIKDKFFK